MTKNVKKETVKVAAVDPKAPPVPDNRQIASFQALAIDWEELERRYRVDYFLDKLKKK